ncbi:MAG: M10 family metallopeptidase [Pseudomonadota bacterium]
MRRKRIEVHSEIEPSGSATPSVTNAKTSVVGTADGQIANSYVEALVGPSAWSNAAPITYHLAYSDWNNNGIDDWNEDGAGDAIRLALELWSHVADVTFVEVATPGQANLVEYIDNADGYLGWHEYPGGWGNQSEGHFNQDGTGWDSLGLGQGGYGFITLVHELGHGLGLEHPHDGDRFPGVSWAGDYGAYRLNQGIYTTMSYLDGWDQLPSPSDNYGWQGGPMAFDIAAIQQIYGRNTTFASGNDSYELPDGNGSGTFFIAIWDTGGTDEIVYSGSRDTTIDLTAATIDRSPTGGGVVSAANGVYGGYTIAQGVWIENASGGTGSDRITGNARANQLNGNGGSDLLIGMGGNDVLDGGGEGDWLSGGFGIDRLIGGLGNDFLIGGRGGDVLIGGEDADRFDFNNIRDSRRADVDFISDFTVGEDLIDLRGIDADVDRRGNQNFRFMGDDALTTRGHQVHFVHDTVNNRTIIEGDVTGDRRVDFKIVLDGLHDLTGYDFIL